jgi:hypothetical protein
MHVREEFRFLNRLRKSGVTNMFGAGPFLENEFDMKPDAARKVLAEWMEWAGENANNLNK